MRVWIEVNKVFGSSDKKLAVIRTLLIHGLRVTEEGIFCGENIRIPYTSIATAIGVDRRTVVETIKEIISNDFLREFFRNIEPAGSSLRKVAKLLGYRVLIIETYEDKPGILASVASALAEKGINIVQVIAEDPNLFKEPKLYIVTSSSVPGEVIDKMLENPIIKRITIS